MDKGNDPKNRMKTRIKIISHDDLRTKRSLIIAEVQDLIKKMNLYNIRYNARLTTLRLKLAKIEKNLGG